MPKRTILILIGIIALAGALRFFALDSIPPGIYPDEAIKGVEGLRAAAQSLDFKIFYPANNGREGLWINLVGIAERALGANQFALRFWPALFGTLTVLGLFLLTKELFGSDRVALLAAFFLATSFWHLNFSRIAFRGIMVPMLMVWGFYFLLSSWGSAEKLKAISYKLKAVFGGLLFGLGFHTYIAFRFAPFVLLTLFGIEYFKSKKEKQPITYKLKPMGWFLAAAFIAALPMGLYFAGHPEDFLGRAGGVSVFATESPLRTLGSMFVKTMGMFNVHGDCNWRHNMACSPQLLFPVGIFFLIGIWTSFRNIFQKAISYKLKAISWFLLSWFLFLLAPAYLTWESIPHALRAIGAIPPVMIGAALGAHYLMEKFSSQKVILVIVIVIVLVSGVIEPYRYFGVWAKNKNTASAFNRSYAEIGAYLNSLPPETSRYVVVNVPGVFVTHVNPDGAEKLIPMPAQAVIYATLKNPPATYLLPEDLYSYPFANEGVIVPLNDNEKVFLTLRARFPGIQLLETETFTVYKMK